MATQSGRWRQAVIAWTRLVRIYQRIDAAGECNFKASGLSTAWFDVLARIKDREGLTQGELAAKLLVTKGNVSQLLAKMEAERLVRRETEGRSRRLWLTPRGRALAKELVPLQEGLLESSLAGLATEERIELARLLRKWEMTAKEALP